MGKTIDKFRSRLYAKKERLARMAYDLDAKYKFLYEKHELRGRILDTKTQELFIDNRSYDLTGENMDFGIDVTVRYKGATVFRAKGPWVSGPMKFMLYRPGEWENRIRDIHSRIRSSRSN